MWKHPHLSRILPALAFLITLVIGVGANPAVAAERAARVVLARGEVSVTDAQQARHELKKDDLVRVGDTVKTGPRGFVQLAFDDRMVLTLRFNSQLRVEAFHFDPNQPKDDQTVTELLKGGMRAVTGLLGSRSPEQVRFDTRVATIGIRGTVIEADEQEGGDWRVTFDYGQGYTETSGGRTDLGPGQSARFGAGQAPQLFDFQRPADDPAALVGALMGLSPAETQQKIAALAPTLSEQNLLLALAMLHQAPGFTPEGLHAFLRGAAGVLPVERTADLAGLATRLHPLETKPILAAVVTKPGEMGPILFAMVRAMEGMPNNAVNALLNEAMKLGLSPPQMFQLLEQLKQNPLVCE